MEEDEQMKCGIHTLRGQLTLPMTEPKRAFLYNGSWTRNFKVIDVQIFPDQIVNNDALFILHYDDNLKAGPDGEDSAQFGWAGIDGLVQQWTYVDPDHVLVNDIFMSAISTAPGNLNYVVKLEQITTTVPEAILDEVKAQLQS